MFLQNSNRKRDVLVMGRANVDMYVSNPDDSLEHSASFEKSVGGCAANIAAGLARLGCRVDLLGRVSDDPFGRYVQSFLESLGVGTALLHRRRPRHQRTRKVHRPIKNDHKTRIKSA